MAVAEYKLHKSGRGMKAPDWVDDGGYWGNSADHTMLGWVPAEADREYWVPDTVSTLTRAEVIARATTIHASTPYQKAADVNDPTSEMINMTVEEVQTMMGDWYDSFHA